MSSKPTALIFGMLDLYDFCIALTYIRGFEYMFSRFGRVFGSVGGRCASFGQF
jgi:hypothetical protein